MLAAVPEDDTLAVRVGAPERDGVEDVSAVGRPPWADCVGQTVSWVWRLTNQQGYTDGSGSSSGSAVEFIVIASQLDVFAAK